MPFDRLVSGLLRSKGFLWLASTDRAALYFSHAGASTCPLAVWICGCFSVSLPLSVCLLAYLPACPPCSRALLASLSVWWQGGR